MALKEPYEQSRGGKKHLDSLEPETVGDAVDLDMSREDLEHLREMVAHSPAKVPEAWLAEFSKAMAEQLEKAHDMSGFEPVISSIAEDVLSELGIRPPAKVPERLLYVEDGGTKKDDYVNGWNECIDAMLTAPHLPPHRRSSEHE